eukprot:11133968-Alexandrium_andersonii.AAC.1
MTEACSGLAAAASVPLPPDLGQALIRTFLPAGLYGCESSAADDAAIRRLHAAVLSFADPKMARGRNPFAAFEAFAAAGAELDLALVI